MKPICSYAKATWRGGFQGAGTIQSGLLRSRFTLPEEFGGRGREVSPEDLLLASASSCYLATLGILLEKAAVSYETLRLESELVTATGRPPRITELKLRPEIWTDSPEPAVMSFFKQALDFCLISQALSPAIMKTLTPRIFPCRAPASMGSSEAVAGRTPLTDPLQ
jgi:peroxiredoxin-like protein